jgi:hypothetical protein
MIGIEPRASYMLGRCSTTDLYLFYFFSPLHFRSVFFITRTSPPNTHTPSNPLEIWWYLLLMVAVPKQEKRLINCPLTPLAECLLLCFLVWKHPCFFWNCHPLPQMLKSELPQHG